MPYANVPKALWGKMDDCVRQVKAKSPGKNAYGICYTSVVGASAQSAAKQRLGKKGG